MHKFTGIILAGGQSKRMGSDKALLPYRGKPLVMYSIELLQPYCETILISSNNPALGTFGYDTVPDIYPKIGPIGGLYSTLTVSSDTHNLVCPCDMPKIKPAVIEKIISTLSGQSAVVVREAAGKTNPLLGYYNRSCLKGLKEQIDKGEYMMQEAVIALNAEKVTIDDHQSLVNMNDLKDME